MRVIIQEDALRMSEGRDFHRFIHELPTIDAAPVVHAHWIIPTYIGSYRAEVPHCSSCNGIPAGVDEKTKYCPHCGARMGAKERSNGG